MRPRASRFRSTFRAAGRRLCAVVAALAGLATGADAATTAPHSFVACEPATAARLAFIEGRLDAGRSYARWWWGGFTSFYAIGTIVSSVEAATESDDGQQANSVVSAVKALGGTVRLALFPPLARDGAAPLAGLPTSDEAACRARLVRAEDLLRRNADEAHERYSWVRHATIVGVNVGGALIVAEGFDEREDAWISAGVGIAVGEIMTWSQPWRAGADLDEYERTFETGVPVPVPVTWAIDPAPTGARLAIRF